MAVMWKGPTAEVRAAWSDPLWGDMVSYLKQHGGIDCFVANDGLSVTYFEIKKIGGEFYRYDLDTVPSDDSYSAILQGCRRFCSITPELIKLHHTYFDRLAAQIESGLASAIKRLEGTADEIREVMSYVRA